MLWCQRDLFECLRDLCTPEVDRGEGGVGERGAGVEARGRGESGGGKFEVDVEGLSINSNRKVIVRGGCIFRGIDWVAETGVVVEGVVLLLLSILNLLTNISYHLNIYICQIILIDLLFCLIDSSKVKI